MIKLIIIKTHFDFKELKARVSSKYRHIDDPRTTTD